ncbi:hypothetical protein [Bacillus sp. Brlt_9]|uniref:hypothetical protein n=1 Tax=Bacillus sp. Brlt_9 TaxID=3110916 RepID=UPI003F7BC23B
MKVIDRFLNELGFSYGFLLDSEEKAYLTKVIKSIDLNVFNDRLDILETFSSQSGGFRIVNWENLIELDIPLTVQLRREISDLFFCFRLEIQSSSRKLEISTDSDFLGTSDMGVVLSEREEAFRVLFPAWDLINPFIDELVWEDKMIQMMMQLIKDVILKCGFMGKIYESLPELLTKDFIKK